MIKAQFFSRLEKPEKIVQCVLCPHNCVIKLDKLGICRVRKNLNGELYSLSYNKFTGYNLDPIEKTPLYHFYPGSNIFSVGSFGCNFKCSFCQNWDISQQGEDSLALMFLDSEALLKLALKSNSIGIAYTYNEPLMNFEWIKDNARIFKTNGLKTVLVSNGYINSEPLDELLPLIDAANIDLKSFREDFYMEMCGGKLKPVLETVKKFVEMKKHLEITTLLIPGKNDSAEEIEKLTDWLADLDPTIPLHFSAYFPTYKLEIPATKMSCLETAYEIAKKKLKYVYLGNIPSIKNYEKYINTYCNKCGAKLVRRMGYQTIVSGLERDCCIKCGEKIKIVY